MLESSQSDRDVARKHNGAQCGVTHQGRKQPLDAGKGDKMAFFLQPPEGMQPCWHHDFTPTRAILNFWPPELWDNEIVLF
jgi:hypothetical protein